MVGRCKCGTFKFGLHNNSLTEIPWLCYQCRDLNEKIRPIVTGIVRQRTRMVPSVVPKQKPPIMFSIKRLELA